MRIKYTPLVNKLTLISILSQQRPVQNPNHLSCQKINPYKVRVAFSRLILALYSQAQQPPCAQQRLSLLCTAQYNMSKSEHLTYIASSQALFITVQKHYLYKTGSKPGGGEGLQTFLTYLSWFHMALCFWKQGSDRNLLCRNISATLEWIFCSFVFSLESHGYTVKFLPITCSYLFTVAVH